MKPSTMGAARKPESQRSRDNMASRLLTLVGEPAEPVEQERGCEDDERPCPAGHLACDRRPIDPERVRQQQVVNGHDCARDHENGTGELLLDALELEAHARPKAFG